MAIAFISSDFALGPDYTIRPGGCGYYRCILPMLVCGQPAHAGILSWDPLYGFGIKESNTTGVYGFNTVMLKLIMSRWTPRQIELAHALGQRIIVDVDDHYDGLTEANAAYDITHPDKNKIRNRDNYRAVIDAADLITVSTPFLYDYLSSRHPNVKMIRNGVNMLPFTRRKQQARPVIGWTGATSYRNNDLEQLRDWLPGFLEEHDLTFHHAGHDPSAPSFADITGVDTRRVTTSPLLPIEQYPEAFLFDIGIVPLNDIPFNHAKSNIKGLEYVAAGIPFVASDLPEYRTLHESGVGLIARSPSEWVSAMTTLLDIDYRKTAARRQYDLVKQHWTIEARAAEWREALA